MSATDILTTQAAKTENFDVLIVGAGISGVGAAYHLTAQRPGTSFVVLEALDSFGGTWWTHQPLDHRSHVLGHGRNATVHRQ